MGMLVNYIVVNFKEVLLNCLKFLIIVLIEL